MSTKTRWPRPSLGIRFVSRRGDINRVPLEDVTLQLLEQYARMTACEGELGIAGREGLKRFAKEYAELKTGQEIKKRANQPNARRPRPNRRVDEEDDILKEFARLIREGHTAREARGNHG